MNIVLGHLHFHVSSNPFVGQFGCVDANDSHVAAGQLLFPVGVGGQVVAAVDAIESPEMDDSDFARSRGESDGLAVEPLFAFQFRSFLIDAIGLGCLADKAKDEEWGEAWRRHARVIIRRRVFIPIIQAYNKNRGTIIMREDDSTKAVWFLTGAAIGAAIALLYAPQSGEETRRLIKKKAGEGSEQLTSQGRELVDRGRELYDKGRAMADEAAEMFERGRRMVQS